MPRRFRTGDQSLVRELNRSILLQRLRVSPPLSRADLAAATGLNKTTVSNLVDELIANGFVREMNSFGMNDTNTDVMKPYGVWAVISPFNRAGGANTIRACTAAARRKPRASIPATAPHCATRHRGYRPDVRGGRRRRPGAVR